VAAANGTVEVTATDVDTGDALANAPVEVVDMSNGEMVAAGATDSAGVYSVSVAESTEYSVFLYAPGYDVVIDDTVNVTAGSTTSVSLSAVEATTGGLRVIAEDPSANPVNNASVNVINPSNESVVISGETSAGVSGDGEVIFQDVAEGDYRLEIAHADYADQVRGVTIAAGTGNDETFVLESQNVLEATHSATDGDIVTDVFVDFNASTNTSVDVSVSADGTDLGAQTYAVTGSDTVQFDVPENGSASEYTVTAEYDSSAVVVDNTGLLYETSGGGGGVGGAANDSTPDMGVIAALAGLAGVILLAGRQSGYY
jgi:hypothetical protein